MTNDLMDLNSVRVLLCDTDVESCQEVLALLKKCCYQVTPVYSAADALDALNSHGHCIDIILPSYFQWRKDFQFHQAGHQFKTDSSDHDVG
uniref:Putative ovule protein n=1 Tax=Solanum chacoense TaxID=4108 RepID=A0A0V0GX43_SOLCH